MAALAALSVTAASADPVPAADVHCHFITPGYLALLERHGALMDELYPIPAWSPEALGAFLDEAGIGLAVLTSVAPQPHFGDAAESAAACRELNDEAARLAAADPARLKWCATLPLPSVPEAVAEAERALDELGAAGVKLPTNARGLYLGDEALDPLMAALDARGAVAILHPHRPEPFDAKLADGLPLAMVEYPAETTRALARLFARNVPARYPNVKFVVPHAGAFLPLALPRMRAVHPIVRAKGFAGKPDDVDKCITDIKNKDAANTDDDPWAEEPETEELELVIRDSEPVRLPEGGSENCCQLPGRASKWHLHRSRCAERSVQILPLREGRGHSRSL